MLHLENKINKFKKTSSENPEKGELASPFSVPCLYSNNSIENDFKNTSETLWDKECKLSTNGRKTAFSLEKNLANFVEKVGINNIGFLTLTFPYCVKDIREASRRFNSVLNLLRKRYLGGIRVIERHKNGGIHFHIIVGLPFDIKTGFNFEEVKNRNYSSASEELKKEWKWLRETMKNYGFGRSELMPIKSSVEGITRYVAKYISKHFKARKEEDKGIRLVTYFGYARECRVANNRFMFLSDNSAKWRKNVNEFAKILSKIKKVKITENNISELIGSDWAYKQRDHILDIFTMSWKVAVNWLSQIQIKKQPLEVI